MSDANPVEQMYLQQSLESSRLSCLSIAAQVCNGEPPERVLKAAMQFAEFVGAYSDAEKRLAG